MFPTADRTFLRSRGAISRRRGMALMVGLLVATFVAILSLSLFDVLLRDHAFDRTQECELRAYMTARAGLEFFKTEVENPAYKLTNSYTYLLNDIRPQDLGAYVQLAAPTLGLAANATLPPQYKQTFTISFTAPGGVNPPWPFDVVSTGEVGLYSASDPPPPTTTGAPYTVTRPQTVMATRTLRTWECDFNQILDYSQ